MKHSPIRALAVIGAALVLMAGGAVAYAAIPSTPGGVIHGCYDSGGNVKVVEDGKPCPKNYTALNWNQAGQPGTNGVSGYDKATHFIDIDVPAVGPQVLSQSVSCPDGKVATGGGGLVNFFNSNGTLAEPGTTVQSSPYDSTGDGNVDSWNFVYARLDGANMVPGQTIAGRVIVICATVN